MILNYAFPFRNDSFFDRETSIGFCNVRTNTQRVQYNNNGRIWVRSLQYTLLPSNVTDLEKLWALTAQTQIHIIFLRFF